MITYDPLSKSLCRPANAIKLIQNLHLNYQTQKPETKIKLFVSPWKSSNFFSVLKLKTVLSIFSSSFPLFENRNGNLSENRKEYRICTVNVAFTPTFCVKTYIFADYKALFLWHFKYPIHGSLGGTFQSSRKHYFGLKHLLSCT